ncbi:MAG: hypothetical protein OEM91_17270 [Hyphomicrobiales bacterium]|nr:hypothetical protein [Hyphomicrobiales bacterium]
MLDQILRAFVMSTLATCQSEQAHRSDSGNWWLSVAILFTMMALLSLMTLSAPIG